MEEKWMVAAKKADFAKLAKEFGIDQVTARLIRNRDVVGEEAVRLYLNGSLQDLHSPHLLKDCDRTAAILQEKIRGERKIRIIGDYDIDGVNASYILYRGLARCGAQVDVDIPDRIRDGYGINEHLIEKAWEAGVDTILTCDNGIAAVSEIAHAKKLGMCVLVTDHHEPQQILPPADTIVNPKQEDCPYPYKNLCGAFVAYKLVEVLYERFQIPEEEALPLIENVAVATVGDVMDLTEENRIVVKEGLRRLKHTENLGMRALIEANGLKDAELSAYHIGFVLGPCINATGRLDTAKRALKLLLAKSEEEAHTLAEELKELNDERKDMTQIWLSKGLELIENTELKQDRVLVVYLPECHESLAGIIAGRIRERYYKPVFVLTDSEGFVKGSGRSIEAYNMFREMEKIQDVFTKFGGHPMAAGLSLEASRVDEFRRRINEAATLTEEELTPKILIDVAMPLDYIREELIAELSVLEPFGKANTKPVFADRKLEILDLRIIGKNRNVLKMQVKNGNGCVMDALYFGDIDRFRAYVEQKFGMEEAEKMFLGRSSGVRLSMTYYPSVNEFRGNRTLQIVIQNYQ